MRLDINLASRPYEDPGSFWLRWGSGLAALTILTLILVGSALMGWYSASKERALIRDYQNQIAAREHERQNAIALLNRPENSYTRDRSQFLNDLFEQKAFSWTKIFAELEHVMPARLHVVSIRPRMSPDHQLQLNLVVAGESRERAVELVRNMEDSPRFQHVLIDEDMNQVNPSSGDAVQFDISSLYVPEGDMDVKRGTR